MNSLKLRRILSNTFIYIILIAMSFIWLFPIVWLFLQSFTAEGAASRVRIAPEYWNFENYKNLLFSKITDGKTFDGYFPIWFGHTLLISICVAVISTLFVLGTAYALSRFRFPTRKAFMKINLILGMFPGFLGLIIIFWGCYALDTMLGFTGDTALFQNNYLVLIIIYSAGSGGGYYIAKGFFDTVSKSIDEAAMIDGASKGQIFWKIILPLSKPVVVYTVLTSFMGPWGEYITASFLLRGNPNTLTIPVGLYQMLTSQSEGAAYYGQFCAGAVIVAIPITALFLSMQKYYVSGVTGGAVKG